MPVPIGARHDQINDLRLSGSTREVSEETDERSVDTVRSGVPSLVISYVAKWQWHVFPVRNKRPITRHGRSDATISTDVISSWAQQYPNCDWAVATGALSKLVVIDIDISEKGNGLDSVAELGVLNPITPTAHTPRGGLHWYFKHPGFFVKTIAGKLAPHVDIRGDGGSITVPPGPRRYWDPHLNLETVPLAEFPEWAIIPEDPKSEVVPRPVVQQLSRYGEAALDAAVEAIVGASAGQQEETLNRECFAIGGLVAGGAIPAALATDALKWAAGQMPSYDSRRQWNRSLLERKVADALLAGMRRPRRPAA